MVKKTLVVITIALVIFIAVVALITTSYPTGVSYGGKIAIIKIEGTVSSQSSLFASSSKPSTIIALLDTAEKDPSIEAVLLEINSPGGSPVACDEISAKIKSMNKTIVAWIGDVGASGGYWIASSADKIVAHPLSLTCSIGALTTIGEFSEFLEGHGINFTTVKSGTYKDIGSPYKELTHEEKQILQNMIDEVQDAFVREVAMNRGLSLDQVELMADGRPCLGTEALNYGLVDQLGNKQDAVSLIQEITGIKKPKLVTLKKKETFFESMIGAELSNAFYAMGMGIGKGLQNQENLEIKS